MGIGGGEGVAEGGEVDVFHHGIRQQGQFPIVVHKMGKSRRRVADGLDALLIRRPLDVRACQVGLGDALYGRGGVHDFVGEHAGEALPRFHLLLGNKFADVLTHIVEQFLQGAFAGKQSFSRQAERKVAVPNGIAHQCGTFLEQALVPVVAPGDEQEGDDNEDDGHGRYFL